MSKYKVEDKVLAKAKITCISIDYVHPIEVEFENGSRVWLEEKDLMLDMTNVETIPQEEVMKSAYNQGLNDAWELGRAILGIADKDNRALLARELITIYGTNDLMLVFALPPQEALAKLKEYEEAQIEVGDVIVSTLYADMNCGVVVNITDNKANLVHKDGTFSAMMPLEFMVKTGKHIDISSILKQIGE